MKKNNKTQFITILTISLSIALACIGSATETPVPVLTSTSTPCIDIPYTPSVEEKSMPTFYFVLVDGTLNYDYKKVNDVSEILEKALPNFLKTGDRVVLSWINDDVPYYGIEKYIFYSDIFLVEDNQVLLTPTLPPTLNPQNTATATPTSLGQLRQTEIAKTVDAVILQEQENIQKALNDYFCQKGEAIAEINEINKIIEQLRRDSVNAFSLDIRNSFPTLEQYETSEGNPLFEVLGEAADFIKTECSLTNYSDCVLIIFSDLKDFRENFPSEKVPYSDMAGKITVLPVFYECQYITSCENKISNWERHFRFFNSGDIYFVLNSDANKETYKEKLATDFSSVILSIKQK